MQISSIQNSLTAIMSMHTAQSAVAKASERISTGLRVNSAADDPAGYGVANKLKVQVGSFSKVLDNLSQGTGIVQVVDDSLTQMVDALTSLRVASVASMGTLSTDDRNMYQTQVDEYLAVMDLTAMTMCMEHKLPVEVFNFRATGNVKRAVLGERVGTIVTDG